VTDVKWISAFPAKIEAETAYAELERIREERGKATASVVVEEATPKTSPLHPQFEWRDRVAAHEHRLAQARQMMRSLVVIKKSRNDPSPERRVLIAVQDQAHPKGERQYVTVADALADPDTRAQVLDEALSRLLAVYSQYSYLSELAGVHAELLMIRARVQTRAA
jgi:hypothetical protein